ncbi:MAG: hypothetical protein C0390_10595 [Syntrophus sp. (in: bacteria)]|nr:hypothetical protein [Syntrophus sp. (in: bacteria)]
MSRADRILRTAFGDARSGSPPAADRRIVRPQAAMRRHRFFKMIPMPVGIEHAKQCKTGG